MGGRSLRPFTHSALLATARRTKKLNADLLALAPLHPTPSRQACIDHQYEFGWQISVTID